MSAMLAATAQLIVRQQMARIASYLAVALALLGGCGIFGYSESQTRDSIRAIGGGSFGIYYPRAVVDKFGPELQTALALYMKDRKIYPNKCSGVIFVAKTVHGEGGQDYSEFRCA